MLLAMSWRPYVKDLLTATTLTKFPSPFFRLWDISASQRRSRLTGLGLEAQRAAITTESSRRGWELLDVFTDAGVRRSCCGGGGPNDSLGRLACRERA